MNKKLKTIVIALAGVLVALIAMVVILIVRNNNTVKDINQLTAKADSLAVMNEDLQISTEFYKLNADFMQLEGQNITLTNDSLVQKYDAARMKVEGLLKELEAERNAHNKDKNALAASRKKIKELEGEISTLKGIMRHYLEEINRLGKENEGLQQRIQEVEKTNENLTSQVTQTTTANRELTQTVQLAKKLNITNLTFNGYKKGKVEKKITKAQQLGAGFTVSPNNTASAGMKTFYMRIISPEGALLGNGGSCTVDGHSIQCTAKRAVEYDNEEKHVDIYWDVNTTLIPGDYTVEIFCDGYRLASKHFTMKK